MSESSQNITKIILRFKVLLIESLTYLKAW